MTDKAKRTEVPIGSPTYEGFMLPDGDYCMSQSQAAKAIGDEPVYALRFLRSKSAQALLGEGYTDYTPEKIEVEPAPGKRGQTRINALPLEVVTAYWLYRSHQGNKQALILSWALMTESLERRFDAAFGVEREESERNQRLQAQIDEMWRVFQNVSEGLALQDDAARERDFLLEEFRRIGHDPYGLPAIED